MIKIRNLSKSFARNILALNNISLNIAEGDFVVLLGPSGAGKSTFLRCINGLVRPSGGSVEVYGRNVHRSWKNLREVRKYTGMIFQQFNLVKRLTVFENVLCGRLGHQNILASSIKFFSREDREFAIYCLERVGLVEKAFQRADQLSGGQQQRVGIARALAQRPRIILADEPVASLDPKSTQNIMNILKNISLEDKITVLVSLHDLAVAKQFAQRVVGIKNGRLCVDKKISLLAESDINEIYQYERVDCGFPGKVKYAHA